MIPDEAKPLKLVIGKLSPLVGLLCQPVLKTFFDAFLEGNKFLVLSQGEADERHDIGQ